MRGGRHGRAHVVDIADAEVDDLSTGDVRDIRPVALRTEDAAARCGGRPLGGRGTLAAIGDGHAVLALGGAVVRAGLRGGKPRKAPVDEQARERQPLAHRGARAVEPVERDAELAQAEGRPDALVEQVAREDIVQILRRKPALLQRALKRAALHGGLALLPGLAAEERVGA